MKLEICSNVSIAEYNPYYNVIIVNPYLENFLDLYYYVVSHEEKHYVNYRSNRNVIHKVFYDIYIDLKDAHISDNLRNEYDRFKKEKDKHNKITLHLIIHGLLYNILHIFIVDMYLLIRNIIKKVRK